MGSTKPVETDDDRGMKSTSALGLEMGDTAGWVRTDGAAGAITSDEISGSRR